MASSEREWPLGVAILLVCLLFFLSLATISKETVRKSSAVEGQWIEEQFGHSTLTRINAIADGWYLKSFDRLDKNSLRDWMSEDPAQRKREERLAEQNNVVLTWAKERKLTLLELGFWVLRRIALFKVLIPLWLPLGLLAVFHGWNERAIKQTDFGYTSPVVNHWYVLFYVESPPSAIDSSNATLWPSRKVATRHWSDSILNGTRRVP